MHSNMKFHFKKYVSKVTFNGLKERQFLNKSIPREADNFSINLFFLGLNPVTNTALDP